VAQGRGPLALFPEPTRASEVNDRRLKSGFPEGKLGCRLGIQVAAEQLFHLDRQKPLTTARGEVARRCKLASAGRTLKDDDGQRAGGADGIGQRRQPAPDRFRDRYLLLISDWAHGSDADEGFID